MRIVVGYPPSEFSVGDMVRGYLRAFRAAGHDVRESSPIKTDMPKRQAVAERIFLDALYHHADLVVLICGMAFDPLLLQLLRRTGLRAVALHTESPYEDDKQTEWSACYPEMLNCTHERVSAERYGWQYLPHAYDPAIHQPAQPDPEEACDVLLIATGWQSRIDLLEQVDWTGIRLCLRGTWTRLRPDSPLRPFYRDGSVMNDQTPRLYASAAICLNLHRGDPDAVSLNPRAYELAACGAFQISDVRAESQRLFGPRVPTFRAPQELSTLIRYYLDRPAERKALGDFARQQVKGETFDRRVASLLDRVGWSYTVCCDGISGIAVPL
jgi:spore maturation protein CgeB